MKKIPKIIVALAISQGISGLSVAASPGAYIGGGVGYGVTKDFEDATRQDNGGVAGQVAAGYNFNQYFGLEAGYSMFSKASYSANDYYGLSADLNVNAFTLLGKGYIPLGKESPWDIYGMVGMAYMLETANVKYYSDNLLSNSRNAPAFAGGGGISRQLTKHIRAGVESLVTQKIDGNETHIPIPQTILTTFNLAYTFD